MDLNMESYSKGRLKSELSSKSTRDSIPVLVGGSGLSYSDNSSLLAPFLGAALVSFFGGGGWFYLAPFAPFSYYY